jgi:hypothetical protein
MTDLCDIYSSILLAIYPVQSDICTCQRKRRTKKTEDKAMWNKGSLKIGNQTFTYSAKVYGEPSEDYGIEGGRISKLEIRLGDFPVARYDRGYQYF